MQIYYLEVNIICIIILMTIFDKYKNECELNYASEYYQKTLLSTVFFSFFDLIAEILRGSMYPFSRIVLLISNSMYFMSGIFIGYYFTNYVLHKIGKQVSKWQKFLILIPVILMGIFLIVNMFNGFLFEIDINNYYSRGNYIKLYLLMELPYIIIIIGNLLYYYFRNTDDKKTREDIGKLLIFTMIPIVSILIQNFNYGITLGQVGVTLAFLLIYLNGQKKDSSIDDLTGIYNRRAFNIYVNKLFNSKKLMFLMLMDANDFKIINDEYGHLEGDKALKEITSILKKAVNSTNADFFLARYGGDEFIIVGEVGSEDEVEKLISNIELEEEKCNRENNNKFVIGLSIGYSLRNDEHTSVEDLIADADNKMYLCKKVMKEKKKIKKGTA